LPSAAQRSNSNKPFEAGETLFEENARKFSLKTVVMFGL
jgi:NADH:ubiquinone oxidoreductase subunit 3 (subunit A)